MVSIQYCNFVFQTSMNVLFLVITTVTPMLPVLTLLVASPVPVTRDTLEMGSHAWVSCANLKLYCLLMQVYAYHGRYK